MRRAVFCALGAALVATGVAAGKGGTQARICGASACRTLTSQDDTLTEWWSRSLRVRRAPLPAPFFTITLLNDTQRATMRVVYAPSRRAIRITPVTNPPSRPSWRTIPTDRIEVFRTATAGLRPHPKSRTWRP
jgi:hypothetical protein